MARNDRLVVSVSPSSAEPAPLDVSAGWVGGAIISGVGAGVAVMALTMPWVAATPAGQGLTVIGLSALPTQGPVFAVFLVVTMVLAGVGFAVSRRGPRLVPLMATLSTLLLAAAALYLGLRPTAVAPTGARDRFDAQLVYPDTPVSLSTGLAFYLSGLLLIGFGLQLSSQLTAARVTVRRAAPTPVSPRRATLTRWVAGVVAVPLVVVSSSAAWSRISDATESASPAAAALDPAAIAAGEWQAIYRTGLTVMLLLVVAAVLSAGTAQRGLRAGGLYLGAGLLLLLGLNALLRWDPGSALADSGGVSVALGGGYVAAIGAVVMLLVLLGGIGWDTAAAPGHDSGDGSSGHTGTRDERDVPA